MHNAAFRAVGLEWTYELLEVAPAELPAVLDRLKAPDVAGANVTIPYKQSVMEHLDSIADDALRARAVNTIVNEGGRLEGFNTDIAAIRLALDEVGVKPHGANAVILGAGGAARAAAQALVGAHITFLTRHPEDAVLPGKAVGWDDPGAAASSRSADVLVNATPLGRREEMPLRPAALPQRGAVIDLVYVTGGTPLVRKARSLGLRTADGWGVLLSQGATAFQLWTGKPAPLEAMRDTLQP
ncbi:MAG: shikimate dehydrogenase [Chloroflexi bacterium]|nr:MAG: shikimate dehydrogenase [Chloroflexota bacterium]